MFANRAAAGRALAQIVRVDPDRTLQILAASREGISVATQVAAALGADLELLCARYSSVAICFEDCRPDVDLDRVVELGLHATEVADHLATLRAELDHTVALYRGHRPFPCLHERHVVLVDDGMTPARVLAAAARRIRQLGAGRATVALPACSLATLRVLADAADDVACVEEADHRGIAFSYAEVEPIGDLEALALLGRSRLAASHVRSAAQRMHGGRT